ncbi:MAG: DUF6311 domain-containing protein, partial [Myxococcales bacterium]
MRPPQNDVPTRPTQPRERVAAGLAALGGLAWFVHLAGARTLDPGNVAFALKGDWAQSTLGWLFFRRGPWRLPLGTLPELVEPLGTSLTFQDSIPWFAVLAKLLAFALPAPAQLVGPWLALCFALQGYFGARLTARFSPSATHQL